MRSLFTFQSRLLLASLSGIRYVACGTVLVFVSVALVASANASMIYGTLSNFDIYNTSPEPAEGAEIELEGCDSSSIGGHYPSHYSSFTAIDYSENGKTGVRLRFEGYNFAGETCAWIAPAES